MPRFLESITRKLGRTAKRKPVQMPGGIWVTGPTEPPSGESVSVFQTEDRILIEPHAWNSETGFHSPVEPIVPIDPDASDEALGLAVRSVLDAHVGEVVAEQVSRSFFKPLLRAAGVDRVADFAPFVRCVSAQRDGHQFKFAPSRNETTRHPRSGWFWIRPYQDLDDPSDAQIGAAIRRSFTDCTFAAPIRRRGRATEPLESA
jgi:hypothetical protein